MNFDVLGVEYVLHVSHEFEGQMAVVEDDPVTSLEAILNLSESRALHLFTHGSLLSWELLELSGVVINGRSGISTSRKQVKHGLVRQRRAVDVSNLIDDRSTEFRVEAGSNELVSSDLSSIFTEASYKAEV